ncbi:hypothetical protein OAP41_02990 [Candidatus Poseidoniaceae archaeon]|nr:hypothetical protein [Candidatus Poseidoniaceae archaeon]
MTYFQYGALVRAEFKLQEPAQNYGRVSRYILANGNVPNSRASHDSGSISIQKFVIKPTSEISSMFEEIQETIEKYQNTPPGGARTKIKTKMQRLKSSLNDSFNQLIFNTQDSIEHVAFVAGNPGLDVMQFLNVAGKSGWETTGQVPGLPGPTGITMMRKRVN